MHPGMHQTKYCTKCSFEHLWYLTQIRFRKRTFSFWTILINTSTVFIISSRKNRLQILINRDKHVKIFSNNFKSRVPNNVCKTSNVSKKYWLKSVTRSVANDTTNSKSAGIRVVKLRIRAYPWKLKKILENLKIEKNTWKSQNWKKNFKNLKIEKKYLEISKIEI